MNALYAIGVDIHQLVRLQQSLYLRPHPGKQHVEFTSSNIASRRCTTHGGGVRRMIRSEKSASLDTITKSRCRANSQTSVSVGPGLRSEAVTSGRLGVNVSREGRFSSKKNPFISSAQPSNDSPSIWMRSPNTPAHPLASGSDTPPASPPPNLPQQEIRAPSAPRFVSREPPVFRYKYLDGL